MGDFGTSKAKHLLGTGAMPNFQLEQQLKKLDLNHEKNMDGKIS